MNKYTKEVRFFVLFVIASMLFGSVLAGHAQTIQEWSDPVNLSMSGSATNPSMVVDNTGIIHVIWIDAFDGYKYAQSADDGVTWTAPVTVKFPFFSEGKPPVLFGDPAGLIHIFWINDLNKLIYAQTLNENLDSPISWRRRVDIDSPVFDFDASMDGQGRMHVAYLKNPAPLPGTAGVYYKRSLDGGINWGAPTFLYESPYFRNLTAETAHIRMAVSDDPEEENVYAVWDDRSQKRIFLASSTDGGLNWGPIKEMVAPQASQGFRTPYNADIDVLGEKLLATWFVGEVGSNCTPYSWFSMDGGETWGEQVAILGESTQCPERSEFFPMDPEYSVSLFVIQGEVAISAWNGDVWSNSEVQLGPSSIVNPSTFDPVLLGCEQAAATMDRLYIVGCDQNPGGDVWFMSRALEPLDNLFPLPSQWSNREEITTAPRMLTSLTSVADATSNVHAVWIQSSYLPTDNFSPKIEYARWDGSDWSTPVPIVSNLIGMPINLVLQIDSHQRLLMSWINQESGELMFTWSDASRANNPLEWHQPLTLPTQSRRANSPDMLVDAADRIAVAYAVTLNEERGIYLIQSTDLGETWSEPVKIFDAVAESWEMADMPKLTVSGDGTLHVLFSRYILLDDPQPVGLYYSSSNDGGVTWTTAETVSDQSVQWSDILAYKDTLHRLWQEKNKETVSTSHQVSTNGGLTWEPRVRIPGEPSIDSQPTVMLDVAGTPHFLQVIEQESQVMVEWGWDNARWELLESRNVASLEFGPPPIMDGGTTSDGMIYAILGFEELLDNGIETNILSVNRRLQITETDEPFVAFISTPSVSALPPPSFEAQPTATNAVSPLAGLEDDPQPGPNRNIIGVALLAVVLVFIVIFTVPRRGQVTNKTDRSK